MQPERHSLIDAHVGQQIRRRRLLLGLSQERLGDYLGLTFQQIQKYENGANRVSASRLFDVSCVMGVAVQYFFDGLPAEATPPRAPPFYGHPTGMAEGQDPLAPPSVAAERDALLVEKDTLDVVRAYRRIAEPAVRKRVYELMKSMGPQA